MFEWLTGSRYHQGQALREQVLSVYRDSGGMVDDYKICQLQKKVRAFVCGQSIRTDADCYDALSKVALPAPRDSGQEHFVRQVCGLDPPERSVPHRRYRDSGMSIGVLGQRAVTHAEVQVSEARLGSLWHVVYPERTRSAIELARGMHGLERFIAAEGAEPRPEGVASGPFDVPEDAVLEARAEGVCQTELDAMIGLASVKTQIKRFIATLQIDQREGVKSQQGLNLFFAGNPGTGKTTVARLYGGILRDLKILPRGHVVEVSRSTLVGGFVGQTAEKTRQVINAAVGGVLFVDEAHSLVRGHENDFGREAIQELMLAMENRRSEVAIIFATYANEVTRLYRMDPGFERRVAENITFDDYSDAELAQMLKDLAAKRRLPMADDLAQRVGALVGQKRRLPNFGNAGTLRKVYERALQERATRLVAQDGLLAPDADPAPLPPFVPADFGL